MGTSIIDPWDNKSSSEIIDPWDNQGPSEIVDPLEFSKPAATANREAFKTDGVVKQGQPPESLASQIFHAPLYAGQTAAGLVSGLGASIVGKIAGEGTAAVQGLRGDPNWGTTAQNVRNKVTEALSYQPRSEPAKQAMGLAGTALEYTVGLPQKGVDYLGDLATEAGYPNLGYTIKDTGETILGAFGGKAAGKALKELPIDAVKQKFNTVVERGYEKAVRPSVSGRNTYGQVTARSEKVADGVRAIIENKNNLELVDSKGNQLPKGSLPTTRDGLGQTAQAIEQTKKTIYDQYTEMRKEAGNPIESLNPVVDYLKKEIENVALEPAQIRHIQRKIDFYSGQKAWGIEDINNKVTMLNNDLRSYYKAPQYGIGKNVEIDAGIAYQLRRIVDDAITRDEGPGYQALRNKHGALLSMEKEVANRYVVSGRRNPKGIADLSNIALAYEVTKGLVSAGSGGVGSVVGAGAGWLAKQAWKRSNNPDVIIGNMFKNAEKFTGRYGTELSEPLPPLGKYDPWAKDIWDKPWKEPISGLLPPPGEYSTSYPYRPVGRPLSNAEWTPGSSSPPQGIVGRPSVSGTPRPIGGEYPANFVQGGVQPQSWYASGSKEMAPDRKVYWVSEDAAAKAAEAKRLLMWLKRSGK